MVSNDSFPARHRWMDGARARPVRSPRLSCTEPNIPASFTLFILYCHPATAQIRRPFPPPAGRSWPRARRAPESRHISPVRSRDRHVLSLSVRGIARTRHGTDTTPGWSRGRGDREATARRGRHGVRERPPRPARLSRAVARRCVLFLLRLL